MKENREELEARIAAYIDGQLPPSEAARLEVFLANTDPALAQQVIGMIAERHAVRALPKVKAPDDLAARIMEQVERTSLLNDVEHFAAPRRPWWQSRLAVAAALFLVLSGFAFFILEGVRRPNSPWRETVMDNDAARHEIAAAPTAASSGLAKSESSSTADTGPSIASLDAVKSSAAKSLATDAPAPAATATPPVESIAAAQPAAAAPSAPNFGVLQKATPSTPLQITLVARDDQDYTRLRSELDQFAAANNQAIGGQSQQLPAAQANSNAGPLAQNNSNYNEQLAARAARGTAQNENGVANPSLDTRQQGTLQSATNSVTRDDAGVEALTYRASLHPEQLRQLTADFQVQSDSPTRARSYAAAPPAGSIGGAGAPPVAAKDVSDLAKQQPADSYIDCLIAILPPAAAHNAPILSTPPASPVTSPASTQPETQPR